MSGSSHPRIAQAQGAQAAIGERLHGRNPVANPYRPGTPTYRRFAYGHDRASKLLDAVLAL